MHLDETVQHAIRRTFVRRGLRRHTFATVEVRQEILDATDTGPLSSARVKGSHGSGHGTTESAGSSRRTYLGFRGTVLGAAEEAGVGPIGRFGYSYRRGTDMTAGMLVSSRETSDHAADAHLVTGRSRWTIEVRVWEREAPWRRLLQPGLPGRHVPQLTGPEGAAPETGRHAVESAWSITLAPDELVAAPVSGPQTAARLLDPTDPGPADDALPLRATTTFSWFGGVAQLHEGVDRALVRASDGDAAATLPGGAGLEATHALVGSWLPGHLRRLFGHPVRGPEFAYQRRLHDLVTGVTASARLFDARYDHDAGDDRNGVPRDVAILRRSDQSVAQATSVRHELGAGGGFRSADLSYDPAMQPGDAPRVAGRGGLTSRFAVSRETGGSSVVSAGFEVSLSATLHTHRVRAASLVTLVATGRRKNLLVDAVLTFARHSPEHTRDLLAALAIVRASGHPAVQPAGRRAVERVFHPDGAHLRVPEEQMREWGLLPPPLPAVRHDGARRWALPPTIVPSNPIPGMHHVEDADRYTPVLQDLVDRLRRDGVPGLSSDQVASLAGQLETWMVGDLVGSTLGGLLGHGVTTMHGARTIAGFDDVIARVRAVPLDDVAVVDVVLDRWRMRNEQYGALTRQEGVVDAAGAEAELHGMLGARGADAENPGASHAGIGGPQLEPSGSADRRRYRRTALRETRAVNHAGPVALLGGRVRFELDVERGHRVVAGPRSDAEDLVFRVPATGLRSSADPDRAGEALRRAAGDRVLGAVDVPGRRAMVLAGTDAVRLRSEAQALLHGDPAVPAGLRDSAGVSRALDVLFSPELFGTIVGRVLAGVEEVATVYDPEDRSQRFTVRLSAVFHEPDTLDLDHQTTMHYGTTGADSRFERLTDQHALEWGPAGVPDLRHGDGVRNTGQVDPVERERGGGEALRPGLADPRANIHRPSGPVRQVGGATHYVLTLSIPPDKGTVLVRPADDAAPRPAVAPARPTELRSELTLHGLTFFLDEPLAAQRLGALGSAVHDAAAVRDRAARAWADAEDRLAALGRRRDRLADDLAGPERAEFDVVVEADDARDRAAAHAADGRPRAAVRLERLAGLLDDRSRLAAEIRDARERWERTQVRMERALAVERAERRLATVERDVARRQEDGRDVTDPVTERDHRNAITTVRARIERERTAARHGLRLAEVATEHSLDVSRAEQDLRASTGSGRRLSDLEDRAVELVAGLDDPAYREIIGTRSATDARSAAQAHRDAGRADAAARLDDLAGLLDERAAAEADARSARARADRSRHEAEQQVRDGQPASPKGSRPAADDGIVPAGPGDLAPEYPWRGRVDAPELHVNERSAVRAAMVREDPRPGLPELPFGRELDQLVDHLRERAGLGEVGPALTGGPRQDVFVACLCRASRSGGVGASSWAGGVSMGSSSGGEFWIGVVDRGRVVGAAVAEHGVDDVGAASGEADQGGVVSFAGGSFAVVVGAAGGVGQGGECGQEQRGFQGVVAALGSGFAFDRGAGAAGDWGEAGVSGEVPGGGEPGAVADDGEDLDGGPDPESGHRGQDRSKRVGLQAGFELVGELVAFGVDLAQLPGDAGDDTGERGRAGNGQALGVERGQDLGGKGAGQSRRPGPHRLGDPVSAELSQGLRGGRGREQVEHATAVQAWPEQAFQGGMNMQQGVAQPVRQPGALPSQVIVVTGEHSEFGEGLVVGADPAQGVRHRPGGLGDHVGVAGVGLGLPGMQVGDAAHRQPGQVGHRDPQITSDGDGQRSDRGGLVDDHQHRAVLGQPGQHGAQRRFVVGQGLVVHPLPVGVDRAGVVFGLAHVQAAEHREPGRVLVRIGQPPLPSRRGRPTTSTRAGSHVTSRPHGSGLYQRSLAPSGHGDNTPQIIGRQGQSVIPRPAACKPSAGLIKKVTGVRRAPRWSCSTCA